MQKKIGGTVFINSLLGKILCYCQQGQYFQCYPLSVNLPKYPESTTQQNESTLSFKPLFNRKYEQN